MEELSRPTRSLVRADTGSTGCPSPVGQASGLTRGRAAVPADSDPRPKSCGDDQLSRPTLPGFEPTRGHPGSRANAVPGPRSCGLHPRSRPTQSWSELTRGHPAVHVDSDTGPRSCGVDQLSWPTPSRVQVYTGWTISPGPFGPVSELRWGPSGVPDDMVPGPRSCGVDQLSQPTRPGFELTWVNHLSRPSRSWVQGAAGRPAVPAA